MISVESLDWRSLPSLPLESREQLPEVAAIYLAIGASDQVLYIGKTINLLKRWIHHHRLGQLLSIGQVRLAWLETPDPVLLDAAEEAMIRHFAPILNGAVMEDYKAKGLINTVADFAKSRGITSAYQFRKASGLPEATSRRLFNCRDVYPSLETMLSLCKTFGAQPGDFLAYIPEDSDEQQQQAS